MEYFQRAVDITPRMAYRLIKALRKLNVECIVAPYEADAQLAYLSLKGYVQAVIRCRLSLHIRGVMRARLSGMHTLTLTSLKRRVLLSSAASQISPILSKIYNICQIVKLLKS
jgi:hypothetical protein